MFGTVLRDVYRWDEARAVRDAIDDLCSPTDNFLWASTGLYAYFDPQASCKIDPGDSLLYIGLAGDLSERFSAHHGMRGKSGKGNKSSQIKQWFNDREYLGITILPQSPLAQINTFRERAAIRRLRVSEGSPLPSNPDDGEASMRGLEGQLLETYKLKFGRLPPWNSIGGAASGQAYAATGSTSALLGLIDGSRHNLLCAQRIIRILSDNPTYGFFESEALHLARVFAIFSPTGASDGVILNKLTRLQRSLHFSPTLRDQVDRINSSGYLRSDSFGLSFEIVSWATVQLEQTS